MGKKDVCGGWANKACGRWQFRLVLTMPLHMSETQGQKPSFFELDEQKSSFVSNAYGLHFSRTEETFKLKKKMQMEYPMSSPGRERSYYVALCHPAQSKNYPIYQCF